MTHPNADLIRRSFEAFANGDQAAMGRFLADDAVWHGASGDVEGREAIFQSFAGLRQDTDSFDQDIHALLADDEHVVALVNSIITRRDRTLKFQQVFVFHITDGKVAEAWVTPVEPAALDAFWAS